MTTPKLQGQALYLELVVNPDLSEDNQRRVTGWRGSNAVKQLLIFPPHTDDTGREHPAKMMSRIVSSTSPRSQWDWVDLNGTTYRGKGVKPESLTKIETDDRGRIELEYYSNDEWDLLPEVAKEESRKVAVQLHLKRAILTSVRESYDDPEVYVEGWVVRNGKPISVETTNLDLEQVEERVTPQAVIRRINKVRDSIPEFPKKLV